MKVCGLIAEYNPFHNGHIHHMEEARKISGCDYLIVVMSGNFVQRGTPAMLNKYDRAEMAIASGADLVLELPVLFSTSTAEVFATAAISLFHQLGCVDKICFGTESGDIRTLQKIATFLNHEPESFSFTVRENMKAGHTYPKARAMALLDYIDDPEDDLQALLEKPNNILGIEYLRAMEKLGTAMEPFTIKRWKTEYHEDQAYYGDVASATALRKMLLNSEEPVAAVTPYIPAFSASMLAADYGVSFPVEEDDFSQILQYRLNSEKNRLSDYLDFSSELRERVQRLLPDCMTYTEWADALNTKNITLTRINRALLHLLLNIRSEELETYREEDFCMYARILGFRRASTPLLSKIDGNTSLPLITKMADAKNRLSDKAFRLLQMDIDAADVYRNIVYQKFGTLLPDEFTSGIRILD